MSGPEHLPHDREGDGRRIAAADEHADEPAFPRRRLQSVHGRYAPLDEATGLLALPRVIDEQERVGDFGIGHPLAPQLLTEHGPGQATRA